MFYISFVGEHGFKGACIIDASSPEAALALATIKGCNPGGEAAFYEMDLPDNIYMDRAKQWEGVLLDRQMLEDLFGPTHTLGEVRAAGHDTSDIHMACSHCNPENVT